MRIERRAQNPKLSTTSKLVFYPVVMTSENISHGGRKEKKGGQAVPCWAHKASCRISAACPSGFLW